MDKGHVTYTPCPKVEYVILKVMPRLLLKISDGGDHR